MRSVIVGAGPTGLYTAVALARRGHQVTVIDRDPGPDGVQWWDRKGVMQFHHPHHFRQQVVDALLAEMPEVWRSLLAAGAVSAVLPGQPGVPAGLHCRRLTFERVLREAARAEPGVRLRTGHADGVCGERGRVTGVMVGGPQVDADLVIDAGGRAGRLTRALRGPAEGGDCGIAYVSRQYQMLPGAAAGPVNMPFGVMVTYPGYLAAVFIHDNRIISALIARASTDRQLAALRTRAAFEAAARAIPALAAWTAPDQARPITPVLPGGRLYNSYRGQLNDAGRVALDGLIYAGDSVCTTNPAAGRGVTTSLLQARQLISLLEEHGRDFTSCSLAFDRWCAGHVKPWFEDHVYWDADLIRRWSGQDVDLTRPLPPDLITAAAQADPEIAKAAGPYQLMLAPPSSLNAVQARARDIYATGWRPPMPPGPTRDELASLVTAAASSRSHPAQDAALSPIGGPGPAAAPMLRIRLVPDQIFATVMQYLFWPPSRPSGPPPPSARRSSSTSAHESRPGKLTVARREVWSASIRSPAGEVSGMHGVETILVLVVLGTVVSAFAGRLRVPAPSLLVIGGLVVALLPRFPPVHVPPDVVSLVVLPPLLYAASEELPWRDLRAVWRPVAVLAVGLVLASAAAVAAVTWAVARVPVSMAFVLGAVLASTDPVAVSALGRRLSLPPKVQALVQAESLFNDATSLVLFQIAVSFAVAGTASTGVAGGVLVHAAGQFVVLAAGGAAAGGAIAAVLIPVRRRVTDPVLETVLALITPYAAYVLGQVVHVSPVMAVIVAGLAIGGRRDRITTAQTRLQLHSVYQTVIFLLESVVFSLIGLQLPTVIRDLSRAEAWPAEALAVTGTLIVIRIVWVFPLSAIIQRRSGTRRLSLPVPAVVSWAGARGVVPLAAALSIPLTTVSGAPLPRRDLILVLATAVIVVSLIVQGLTLEPLVRQAGIARPDAARHEETVARLRLAEAALARLDELAGGECATDDVIDRARASLQARLGHTRTRIDGTRAPEPDGLTDRELRCDLNAAENAELARLYDNGTISQTTRQRLQRGLDLEAARLSEQH